MSQVTIRRPFGELDLCNQLSFEPHTVFHFFLGQSPLPSFFLKQIGKRAIINRFLEQQVLAKGTLEELKGSRLAA
jgi:hypothetical protein